MTQTKEFINIKTVYLEYTEGCCWRRNLDLEVIKQFFLKNGVEIIRNPKEADVIILMTCAFVKRTEDISVNKIKILSADYGEKLVVVGCLSGINMERLREHFDGVAINTADIENINKYFPEFTYKFKLTDDSNNLFLQADLKSVNITLLSIIRYLYFSFNFSGKYFRNLINNFKKILNAKMGVNRKIYYLRIAWGCAEPHCTFCVEWKAVGSKEISKPLEDCLKEVKNGLQEGFTHFCIVADNPGAWGIDIGKKLPELIKAILDIDPSIIISNIDGVHPYWIKQYKEDFINLFKTGRIKSIMSALQSGSNRILKLMNRRHSREEYLDIIREIKNVYPDIILITQIIVGFPSETFEEFLESVDLVIEAGFTNVLFFPYYCNPCTPAFNYDGKLSDEEKFKRVKFAFNKIMKQGILSFNLGIENHPQHQKVKALYDHK